MEYVAQDAGFPGAIIRPPLVNPPYSEPVKGYTDDPHQALTGFGMLTALGFLKVVTIDGNLRFLTSYADVVVNQILAAAWDSNMAHKVHKEIEGKDQLIPKVVATSGPAVTVYNSGTMGQTVNEMIKIGIKLANKTPSMFVARPLTEFQCVKKTRWNIIKAFFINTCFAYLIDIVLKVAGHRPMMARLMRKLKRVQKDLLGLEVCLSQSELVAQNFDNIASNMMEEEKEIFYFSQPLPDEEYYQEWGLWGRRNIMKEKDHTIPTAIKRLKIMTIVCNTLKWAFFMLIFGLIIFVIFSLSM